MGKYQGIYIRGNFTDKGDIPSGTAVPTYSPDVICYQNNLLLPIVAETSYAKSINMTFINDSINNISDSE